ncbi:MAG: hypothetical protein JSS94_09950 [Bacteroidetes bacterium]|nr:hypothetical protein [Bacteroidota bacterium]
MIFRDCLQYSGKIFALFCGLNLIFSCASTQKKQSEPIYNTSNCNQDNTYHYSVRDIPTPFHNLKVDTLLSNRFHEKELNLAHSIGISQLLSDYIQLKKKQKQQPSLENQLQQIQLKQSINSKMDLASLEISSVAAELDCEEERITQIASYLKEKEAKTETRLTVGSIILGSATAIVTGVLLGSDSESKAADYIGVGVGIADAALGIMILTNHRKVVLKHERNVLREIWTSSPTSSVYPPSIWYYLNYANPNHPGETSLRAQLIANWKNYGQVRKSKKEAELDIYFGNGGTYTTDQLDNRASMYDQIESTIKLMKQDLRNLTLNIEKLEKIN